MAQKFFTIKRLIVLVAVVFILCLICDVIITTYIGSRRVRFQIECAVNLRDLGKVFFVYAEDSNGRYPAPDKWCDLLSERGYADEEGFKCPANKKARCSFAMNPYCEPDSPRYIVLLFEAKSGWNQFGGPELLNIENHNSRGCNVLFADGHVEFISQNNDSKLIWKAEGIDSNGL